MHARLASAAATAAGLALVLAACGSRDDGDGGTDTAEGAISVDTLNGPVNLDEPATRVVAVEWSLAEDLLALGIEPVGMADIEGYRDWVAAGPQPGDDVTDIGARDEPSLEQIEALDPDLILTDDNRAVTNLADLQAIAPTYSSDFYGQDGGQLQTMRDTFTDIAVLTGREAEAEDVLAELDARAEEFEAAISESDASKTFLLTQGYTFEGAATVRVFGKPTIASELLESAGMTNGWTDKVDDYGLADVDVEGLLKADPSSSLIYVAQPNDNIFTGELANNPVYKGLDFVKQGRVHPIDPGAWLWPGPVTSITIYDEVAAALGL